MENTTTTTTTTEATETNAPVTVSKLKRAFESYVAEALKAAGGTDKSGKTVRARFHGFSIPKFVSADFQTAFNLFMEAGDLEASMQKVLQLRRVLVTCQYNYAKKDAVALLDRLIGGLRCEADLRTNVSEAREKYGKMLNERHHLDSFSAQFWLVHDTVVEADRIQTERVAQRDAEKEAERKAKRELREARLEANRQAAEEINRKHRQNVGRTIMDQLSQITGQKFSSVA